MEAAASPGVPPVRHVWDSPTRDLSPQSAPSLDSSAQKHGSVGESSEPRGPAVVSPDRRVFPAPGARDLSDNSRFHTKARVLQGCEPPGPDGRPSVDSSGPVGAIFQEVNRIRAGGEDVDGIDTDLKSKYGDSWFARIAVHRKFEAIVLAVISVNSLWIGVDVQWNREENLYDAHWIFPLMENFFCSFFLMEIVIRLFAFKKTHYAFTDAWFIFDSFLCVLMILETWVVLIIGSGVTGGLGFLRLLRLLRIARMARIIRSFPELLTLIKGMFAAIKAVGTTFALQLLLLYIYAILFTGQYHRDLAPEPEPTDDSTWIYDVFGSIPMSMFTLFVVGTLLDDCADLIGVIKEENFWMLAVFLSFIVVSSFMVLNMLIGILCEVVSATKEGEEIKAKEATARSALQKFFAQLNEESDGEGEGELTVERFRQLMTNQEVLTTMMELGIEPQHLVQYVDVLFEPDHPGKEKLVLEMSTLMDEVLRLHPKKNASFLDVTDLRKEMRLLSSDMNDRLMNMQVLVQEPKIPEALQEVMGLTTTQDTQQPPSKLNTVIEWPEGPGFGIEGAVERLRDVSTQEILEELQLRSKRIQVGRAAANPQEQVTASGGQKKAAGRPVTEVEDPQAAESARRKKSKEAQQQASDKIPEPDKIASEDSSADPTALLAHAATLPGDACWRWDPKLGTLSYMVEDSPTVLTLKEQEGELAKPDEAEGTHDGEEDVEKKASYMDDSVSWSSEWQEV